VKKVLILSLLFLFSCTTAPISGRRQLITVSSQEEQTLGLQSFQQIVNQSKVIKGTPAANQVTRVGQNLAKHIDANYAWEFVLIDDKQINAFCLPGGKVAVYSGILSVTQDDDGMAVVMGHEIAHALARHGAERMSQDSLINLGGQLLGLGTGSNAVTAAYGLVSNYGVALPFNRKQESEADYIGLIIMSKSGYDPRKAVGFWQRMSSAGGGKTPQFLSTHPSDSTRIADIQKHMSEAMMYYTASAKK
jgi:predicted Zn-dependent protease